MPAQAGIILKFSPSETRAVFILIPSSEVLKFEQFEEWSEVLKFEQWSADQWAGIKVYKTDPNSRQLI